MVYCTNIADKLDISCGSAYSIIQEDVVRVWLLGQPKTFFTGGIRKLVA
jgi:hypothetical protein